HVTQRIVASEVDRGGLRAAFVICSRILSRNKERHLMRKLYLVVAVILVCSAMGSAQDRAKRVTGNDEMQVKQRITDEWAAWTAMNYSKLDGFYAKDASLTFFDIAPFQYKGWQAYKKGASQMLTAYTSLTGKLGDDVSIHVN